METSWIERTTKKWFGNPGEKIKKVAVFLFWLTTFLSVAAVVLFIILEMIDSWYANGWYILLSVLLIFVQYFNCLVLYGFGQLVENSSNHRSPQPKTPPTPSVIKYDDLPAL